MATIVKRLFVLLPHSVDQRRWLPSNVCHFKLNVDAARGLRVVGALVRSCATIMGVLSWWHASLERRLDDYSVVEVVALCGGLCFAHDCCFSRVQVEVDALGVVPSFHCSNRPIWSYLGQIVDDCKFLAAHFQFCSLAHIFKDCNSVVHLLAKWVTKNVDQVWLEASPPIIQDVVVSDCSFSSGC